MGGWSVTERAGAVVLGVALMLALAPGVGQAQSSAAFQQAQDAYFQGDFRRVVELLGPLVDTPDPQIRDVIILREARKLLGAAYVLNGRAERGGLIFEALLRQILNDSTASEFERYALDPAQFPDEVLAVFRQVHQRLQAEVDAQRTDQERREAEARERRRQALLSLVAQAQDAEHEVELDPAPTFVPFGVGQFYNGNNDLGYAFLLIEGGLFLGSFVVGGVWLAAEQAQVDHPEFGRVPSSQGHADLLNGTLIATNIISATFLAVAIVGVVEARLSFRPSRTVRQRREIPEDVLRELELGIGPGGVSLRGRF